jgi:hypothetical protein
MPPFIPVAFAALSVLAAAALGFSERSFLGTALEDQFYGFFFRSYPLFLFVVSYGAARIVVAALTEPGRRRVLRALTAPPAVALFLAACIYPSVGGFVLRSGFAAGGVSFLQGLNAHAAAVLGAGAAAFMFGLVLGICTLLATLRFRFRRRGLADALLSFLALWVGAAILLAPQRLGVDLLGAFPLRPLGFAQALPLAGLVALAVLPHALVQARRTGPAPAQA